ncbi:MAG: hypothetical protein M3Y07_00300, partial [Acidobacteriota bacterium]|nr:hypothetical protein [Acidobacteriota bacterium]
MTVDLLRDGFYGLKRKAAPGVDDVTWKEYETGLEDRLSDLHGRVHRGAYRALPSKRSWIPKANCGPHSLIEHRASIEGPTTKTPPNLLRMSVGLENV